MVYEYALEKYDSVKNEFTKSETRSEEQEFEHFKRRRLVEHDRKAQMEHPVHARAVSCSTSPAAALEEQRPVCPAYKIWKHHQLTGTQIYVRKRGTPGFYNTLPTSMVASDGSSECCSICNGQVGTHFYTFSYDAWSAPNRMPRHAVVVPQRGCIADQRIPHVPSRRCHGVQQHRRADCVGASTVAAATQSSVSASYRSAWGAVRDACEPECDVVLHANNHDAHSDGGYRPLCSPRLLRARSTIRTFRASRIFRRT